MVHDVHSTDGNAVTRLRPVV